uniref:Uncharacterized protein n=1 Tax=Globodera rostochiensis TaxID=31243 RepID=A0A914I803_GLORO
MCCCLRKWMIATAAARWRAVDDNDDDADDGGVEDGTGTCVGWMDGMDVQLKPKSKSIAAIHSSAGRQHLPTKELAEYEEPGMKNRDGGESVRDERVGERVYWDRQKEVETGARECLGQGSGRESGLGQTEEAETGAKECTGRERLPQHAHRQQQQQQQQQQNIPSLPHSHSSFYFPTT